MALTVRKTYNRRARRSLVCAGVAMADGSVHDEGTEAGPMGEDEAIALVRTKDPHFVDVRREDLLARMHPRDRPAAAIPPMIVAPAPKSDAMKAPAAARGSRSATMDGAKLPWTQIGALLAVPVCAADLFLQWQGANFDGAGRNFGRFCATVVLTTLLGFVAGAIRDAVSGARRKQARRRKTPARKTLPRQGPSPANVVARHWRGELPLWVSGWVLGVGSGGGVSVMPAVIANFTAGQSYNPALIFSATAGVWIAVFAIAVWQVVGMWRSAARHAETPPRSDTGTADLAALWSALARLVAIVGFASLFATFATQWLPQLVELYKIAFYDDPEIPAYAIRMTADGTEAEIAGGFKYGLADDFAAIAREAPRLRVVRLDSAGGRLGEGERLFKLIRELSLDTYVSSKCFSSCTLAFAGGRERILKKGATLGFHKADFPGVNDNEFDSLQYRVFSAAGFDGAFIARALATPHRDLWTPSPAALLAARVITAVADGSRRGRPALGGNVTAPGHAVAAK
jgi:hypothetical protein